MPRLLFAISAHGLGHLGQAAPVCNALRTLRPNLELFVWSALPKAALEQRIHVPFVHIAEACDIGFVMHDALRVDVAASWQRYLARETQWTAHLDAACAIVRQHAPDLIVSDVGDMPLAAGQALHIPTISMSSLNWADMAHAYFADMPDSAPVLDRLREIYDEVTCAMRLSPGMPMRGRTERILPPVGAVSMLTRAQLDAHLASGLPNPGQPRILIGMGGIETILPIDLWPLQSELNLIVANQATLASEGDPDRGIVNADTWHALHGWHFSDLLAGCDAVICKPGYGTFVEAALAGVPVLYVPRPQWPEQTVLIEWLQQHARCAEITANELAHGHFLEHLNRLMAQPRRPPLPRDGDAIAGRAILSLLNPSEREAQRFE